MGAAPSVSEQKESICEPYKGYFSTLLTRLEEPDILTELIKGRMAFTTSYIHRYNAYTRDFFEHLIQLKTLNAAEYKFYQQNKDMDEVLFEKTVREGISTGIYTPLLLAIDLTMPEPPRWPDGWNQFIETRHNYVTPSKTGMFRIDGVCFTFDQAFYANVDFVNTYITGKSNNS